MITDAVNIASLEAAAKTLGQTPTVIAPGKPIAWELSVKEESPLEFVGTETMDFNNDKIVVTHCTFGNDSHALQLWTADPGGLVVRLGNLVLANYKQYRPIIPEVVTEGSRRNTLPRRPIKSTTPCPRFASKTTCPVTRLIRT
jgi:hypothetical protein